MTSCATAATYSYTHKSVKVLTIAIHFMCKLGFKIAYIMLLACGYNGGGTLLYII